VSRSSLVWSAVLAVAVLVPRAIRADESPNAADEYRKAIELLPKLKAEDTKVFYDRKLPPTSKKATELIERCSRALEALERGTAIQRCEWEFDWKKAFNRPGRDSGKVRDLCDVMLLRARQRLHQKQLGEALDDVTAAIVFARRYGGSGACTDRLLQGALEGQACIILATYLPQLNPEQRGELQKRIRGLPAPAPLERNLVQYEKQVFITYVQMVFEQKSEEEVLELVQFLRSEEEVAAIMKLSGGKKDGILKLVKDAGPFIDELGKLVMLPDKEYQAALDPFRKKCLDKNPYAFQMIKLADSMRIYTNASSVRWTMLWAAVAVADDGPDRLKHFKDPHGDGPFAYQAFKGGFRLTSKLRYPGSAEGSQVTLLVGIEPENKQK
jgi:hypothetical protein